MVRERIAIGSEQTSSRFPQKGKETLTADRDITLDEINRFQGFAFDPGGANRNVDLPAEGSCKGVVLHISNEADAAELLTVRDDADATIVTVSQNERVQLLCDGTDWHATVGRKAASRVVAKGVETLSAARTITAAEVNTFSAFSFDPGGAARDVNLPAEADAKGVVLYISNEADAVEILTIKDDAAATIVTPTQNEAAIVWCDGTSWFGLVGATS